MEQKLTLITALERICEASPNSQLSKEFLDGISEYTSYVGDKLHINPVQSVLLAILLDSGSAMSLKEMADHLNCSNIRMMVYEHELTEMHRMWIIGWQTVKGYHKNDFRYTIRPAIVKAIMDNCSYQAPVLSEFTAFDVIDQIGKWMRMIDADNDLFDKIYKVIIEFLNDTIHLKMSKELLALNLVQNDMIMLIVAIWQMVINHKNVIEQDDYEDYFRDKRTALLEATRIDEGSSRLSKLELLENDIENGISVPKSFRLTDHAMELLLCDVEYLIDNQNNLGKNVILPAQIANKELFYNERERQAIDDLRRLLEQQLFQQIQERLTSHNLRKGFTCLFYGQPGTGKTETVFQLCKESGRSIVVVDAAELKSKWLGDSEKRIQSLFKQYEKMVKDYKTCPVLLFNEADAIIGKRTTDITGSVSRTENTCQNIILQAMENFSGIMIATTNLTENMDAAFERRFLYKIKFEKPETIVKQQIWQSMIPSLSADEAYHLSHSFDFSGGQIENISRKTIINTVLYNSQPVFSQIKQFCHDEEIDSNRPHIGF